MKFYDEFGKCVACGFVGIDLHHIKTKKAGGSNGAHNLIPLCHKHHVECHQIGMKKFTELKIKKNGASGEEVLLWLLEKGWYVDAASDRWVNPMEFE